MSVFERVRLLGFGLLAVTFVVGALAGAAVDRAVLDTSTKPAGQERHDDGDDDHDRSYVIDRVEMSDGQRATIDSILERRVERMRAVWRELEPQLDAITDSARSEIMSVLTAEQQAEYRELLDRRRDRRDRNDKDDAKPDTSRNDDRDSNEDDRDRR